MKKMKKSVKVVLISIVAVVCVLAIVLGCIFGLRDDRTTTNNKLLNDFNNLTNEINDVNYAMSDFNIFERIPFNEIEDTNFSINNIQRLGSNYFSYIDSNSNEIFYLYKEIEQGQYALFNLSNLENDNEPGFVKEGSLSYSINSVNESYVIIESVYSNRSETLTYDAVFSVIYIGGDTPIEVLTIDTRDSNTIMVNLLLNEETLACQTYTVPDGYALNDGLSVANFNFAILDLPTEKSTYDDVLLYEYGETQINMSDRCSLTYNGNFYILYIKDNVEFFVISNNNVSKLEINKDNVSVSLSKLTNEKLLIEYAEIVDETNSTAVAVQETAFSEIIYYKYSYSILDLNTMTETNLNIGDYAKIEAGQISENSSNYYLIKEKVNESHNLVLEDVLYEYYTSDNNLIVSYNSSSGNNIIKIRNNFVLTSDNTFKFENVNKLSLVSENLTNGNIVGTVNDFAYTYVNSNGSYGIIDLENNKIVDADNAEESFSYIYPVSEGFAIGVKNEKYYLINIIDKSINEIESFYSENARLLTLLEHGMPYYVIQQTDNTLAIYKGNDEVIENITRINIFNIATGEVIIEVDTVSGQIIISTGINLTFNDETVQNFEENPVEYKALEIDLTNMSITPYGDNGNQANSSGSIDINTWCNYAWFSNTQSVYTVYCRMQYYYISRVSFYVDYDYGNDTMTLTSSMSTSQAISASASCTQNHVSTTSLTVSSSISDGYVTYVITHNYKSGNWGTEHNGYGTSSLWGFPYIVEYDLDGGSGLSSTVTYNYGVTINPSASVYKSGYELSYWSVSNTSGTWENYYNESWHSRTGSVSIGSESTFRNLRNNGGTANMDAYWIANTYSISYNLNGGSYGTYHPTSARYDSWVNISNPTRIGYTFSSWTITGMTSGTTHYFGTSSSSYTTNTSSSYTTVSSYDYFKNLGTADGQTVTFRANWTANSYSITYNLDGGSFTSGASHPTTAYFDEWFYVDNPIKDGNSFDGWDINGYMTTGHEKYLGRTSPTADYVIAENVNAAFGLSGYKYFCNLSSSNQGSITITARWNAVSYSISYTLNGGTHGSSHPTSASYDAWFQVSNPTRTGYTFTGWSITGMSSDTHYIGTSSSSYITTTATSYSTTTSQRYFMNLQVTSGTVYFSANWSAISYSISYTLNGGTHGSSHPTSASLNSWFQVSNPSRDGYLFTGWTITNMNSNITHYYGTSTSSYNTNTSTSYTTSSSQTYFRSLRSASGTVTFTANWTAITYNIQYNANGGVLGELQPSSAKFGSWFNVSAPTDNSGYRFAGWTVSGASNECEHYYGVSSSSYETATGTTFVTDENQLFFRDLHIENGATVTLTANWQPVGYSIDYNLNGGTHGAQAPDLAIFNENVTISNPTREGYTFTGWTFSGLVDSVTHYYYSGSIEIAFTSTNGRYVSETNANYDVLVMATVFRNLGTTGDGPILTANWTSAYYTITYHFMPADTDVSDYTLSNLNRAGNMTVTATQQVRYDTKFESYVSAVNVLADNQVEIPQGVRLLYWVVNNSGSTYSSSTNLISWNSDYSQSTPVSGKSINPGVEEIYSSENGYSARNIHLYAAYAYVDITVRYMVASGEQYRNDLSSYYEYTTEVVMYSSTYELFSIANSGIIGWLITPNHYDFGQLTSDSYTTFTDNGIYYDALAGNTILWIFSNTSAYDIDNPIYYAYAVY